MKKLSLVLATFLGFCAQPLWADNGCTEQMAVAMRWDGTTNDQMTCIGTKSIGQLGIAALCSADKTVISEHFADYLAYRTRWAQNFNDYVDTKDADVKAVKLQSLRDVERFWNLSAHRDEVELALYQIRVAKSDCFDRM